MIGALLFLASVSAVLSFSSWHLFDGTIPAGGVLGMLVADYLLTSLNPAGAVLLDVAMLVVSLYLVSTFSLDKFLEPGLCRSAAPRDENRRQMERMA